MIGKNSKRAKEELEDSSTTPIDHDLILSLDDLLPGDVLLYRPQLSSYVSRKISEATRSPYTHAAIYVGDGNVADSMPPKGVSRRPLADTMQNNRCVAVFRNQCGFGDDRQKTLYTFVDAVLGERKFYDVLGVGNFQKDSPKYFDNQLEFIQNNFGKLTSLDDFAKQKFFCSAFVVACYSVVGIIGESAQVAYQPEFFSPGHLSQDPTFGWLLVYLIPKNGSVPSDDPALKATLWCDFKDQHWW